GFALSSFYNCGEVERASSCIETDRIPKREPKGQWEWIYFHVRRNRQQNLDGIHTTNRDFCRTSFLCLQQERKQVLYYSRCRSKAVQCPFRTVWGLVQVLPYDTFNNPENGYVFEGGQCEFGVDVIVAPPLTNWEIHSFNEKFSGPKFSWALKNFSELNLNNLTSDIFSMGGRKWVLRLYPKGDSRADGKWLSVYLELAASDTLKEDEKIFVQANLRVLDPLGSNHIEQKMNVWCEVQKPSWGWYNFMSLAELRMAYLDNKEHALNLEVEFKVVSATSYSPIK
ncbi:unnamed protein product, partial [Brassica oleracea]